jgi:hypothetical protein
VVAGTATSHRVRGVPRSWTLIRVHGRTIEVTPREEAAGAWTAGPTVRFDRGQLRDR